MDEVTDARSTVDRIDALLDQIRRDELRALRQAARRANAAAAGRARVVVWLRDEGTGKVTTVEGA